MVPPRVPWRFLDDKRDATFSLMPTLDLSELVSHPIFRTHFTVHPAMFKSPKAESRVIMRAAHLRSDFSVGGTGVGLT
jgi:hypothetical protein